MAEEKKKGKFNVKYATIVMVFLFVVVVVIASIALSKTDKSSSGAYDAKGEDVSDVGTLMAQRGNVTKVVSDDATINDLTTTSVTSDDVQAKSFLVDKLDIAQTFKSTSATVSSLTVGNPSYILPSAKGTANQVLAVPVTGNQLTFVNINKDFINPPDSAQEHGLGIFGSTPEIVESSAVTLTPDGTLAGVTVIDLGPNVGSLSVPGNEFTLKAVDNPAIGLGNVKLETPMLQLATKEMNYFATVSSNVSANIDPLPLAPIHIVKLAANVEVTSITAPTADGSRMIIVTGDTLDQYRLHFPQGVVVGHDALADFTLSDYQSIEIVSLNGAWILMSTTGTVGPT